MNYDVPLPEADDPDDTLDRPSRAHARVLDEIDLLPVGAVVRGVWITPFETPAAGGGDQWYWRLETSLQVASRPSRDHRQISDAQIARLRRYNRQVALDAYLLAADHDANGNANDDEAP